MPKVERRGHEVVGARRSRSTASPHGNDAKVPPLRYERSRCAPAPDAEMELDQSAPADAAMGSNGLFLTASLLDYAAGLAVDVAMKDETPPQTRRPHSSSLMPRPDPQLAAAAEAASETAGTTAATASALLEELLHGRISISAAAAASAAAASAADEAWVHSASSLPRT